MYSLKLILFVLVLCLPYCWSSFDKDWTFKHDQVDKNHRISFHVALKQRNVHLLEELLMSVSDPESPKYGKHATKEEIASIVSPPKEEVEEVSNWFYRQSVGGDDVIIHHYDDALKISASIDYVSRVFKAGFKWYVHGPTQHSVVRSDEKGITIPNEISEKIEFITGLVAFPIIPRKAYTKKTAVVSEAANSTYNYFSTTNVRSLYNIPATAKVVAKSSQCAVEFAPEDGFSDPDLQTFCKLSGEAYTPFTKIIGPNNGFGTESELDVQVLASVGSGAENWFWMITDGWIYEMAVEIFNSTTKPWVLSISYGWPEISTCNSIAVRSNCTGTDYKGYLARANTELMKLGALGLSVITCSQDEGAPSEANVQCSDTTKHPVYGIYPGSSPYVTTVSGTTAGPDATKGSLTPPICKNHPCDNLSTREVACMPSNTLAGWTTGGGFSEISVRPSYQSSVVENYLKTTSAQPPTKFFWPANRGYPDLSAIGARVLIVSRGSVTVAEGTSASTPIVAGMVTLLNDYRFQNKKSPLGFLNPLLYKMAADEPETFKDITEGRNNYTFSYYTSTAKCFGFETTPGWDAVTGLGTPNYGNIFDYVKKLAN